MSQRTQFEVLAETAEYLAKDIHSPQALEAELQFRLEGVQALLDSGQWIEDASGNLIPRRLSKVSREVVARCAQYCIVEMPPLCDPEVEWTADRSILEGVNFLLMGEDLRQYGIVNFTVSFEHNSLMSNSTIKNTNVGTA